MINVIARKPNGDLVFRAATSKEQESIIRRNLWSKSFESPKVRDHNRELHTTSEYLADQARKVERMRDRARWSR